MKANAPYTNPEYQWIEAIKHYPCKLIFGARGSGKTEKMYFVAQSGIDRQSRVSLATLVKVETFTGLAVYEGPENVATGLIEFTKEARRRLGDRSIIEGYDPLVDEVHWMMCCDGMTNWEDGVSASVLKDFWGVCTQLLRQANMSVCIVVDGFNVSLGGDALKGKLDVTLRQFVRLMAIPTPDESVPGGFRCSGKAVLTILREAPVQVSVPLWMQGPKNLDRSPLNV